MNVRNQVRQRARALARTPVLSLASVSTLAVGFGIAAAVGAIVYVTLLRPLPFPDADRIVGSWLTSPNMVIERARHSQITFLHFRDRNRVFGSFAIAEPLAVTLDDDVEPRRLRAAVVTASIADVLGVAPALGRGLTEDHDAPGAEPVAVLTHELWIDQFGGDPTLVGGSVRIDGTRTRIVGVLPEGVRFPQPDTDLWIPLRIDPAMPDGNFFYTAYGRLLPGQTAESAHAEGSRLIALLPQAHPFFTEESLRRFDLRPVMVPLLDDLVAEVATPLWMLLAASLALLVVVCANVANLLLVRSERLRLEMAIRTSLGAGRRSLVLLSATDTALLAGIGGVAGASLAIGGIGAMAPTLSAYLPRPVGPDVWVGAAVTALLLSVLAAAVTGLVPAARASLAEAEATLRAGRGSSGMSGMGARLIQALVTAQFALAFTLIVGSAWLGTAMVSLRAVDPGFDPNGGFGLRVALTEQSYPDAAAVERAVSDLVAAMGSVPGVAGAAAASHLPLRDFRVLVPYETEDFPPTGEDLPRPTLTKAIAGPYFETMRIPVLAGRGLARSDTEPAVRSVVVNRAFVRRHWSDEDADAIGKRIRIGREGQWFTIVGVVGEVRDRSLTSPAPEIVYFPIVAEIQAHGVEWREVSFVLRTASDLSPDLRALRAAVASVDPSLALYDAEPLGATVSQARRGTVAAGLLVTAATAATTLVAVVGLYGLMAHLVRARRREIGLRIALGASGVTIRRAYALRMILLAATGVGVGAALALGGSGVAEALLFGVRTRAPFPFIASAFALLALGLVATELPIRRALTTPPSRALSAE